jgi:type II secretory pathway pseudopilin PulG
MRAGSRAACGGVRFGGHSQRGFTFVWALMAIAIFALGLAVIGPRWSDDAKRDKERELLKIGAMYARAIAAYRTASPGSVKNYPPKLESLLSDERMVSMTRYLRKLYADPLDSARPWGVVLGDDGTVRGIYSQVQATPLNTEAIDLGVLALPPAQRYSDWKFVPKITE